MIEVPIWAFTLALFYMIVMQFLLSAYIVKTIKKSKSVMKPYTENRQYYNKNNNNPVHPHTITKAMKKSTNGGRTNDP